MRSTCHRELGLNNHLTFERLNTDPVNSLADERRIATAECAAAPVEPLCERNACFEARAPCRR